MNKSLFLFIFALLLTSSLVSALDVGYVVRTTSNMDVNELALQTFMDSEGYTVTILDDSVFDEDLYDLIIVSESVSDIANIFDHTDTRTIFMSNTAAKKKGLASTPGVSSDRFLTIEQSFGITDGYSLGSLQVYNNQDAVEYLTGCFPINSDSLASKSDSSKSIILALETDSLLIDSSCTDRDKQITEKNMYFGLTVVSEWNSNAEELFRNSIAWLIESQDLDGDGFDGVIDCDDDDVNVYPGAIEIAYNGIDDDCSDGDLRDVDLDGYDSLSVGGEDCNDNDSSINPGSSDESKDCLNDGPVINSFSPTSPIELFENTDTTFTVSYTDVDNGDEVSVRWKVNGLVDGLGDTYVFNKPEGEYTVIAVVFEGGYDVEQSWVVSVKDSSFFTCEEVSGDICTTSEQCGGNSFSANNTNSCCSITCVDKDPEFSAASVCTIEDNRVDVDFLNIDSDYRVDEDIKFSLRIRNNLNDDKDFDVKVYLYDYTDEKVIDKQSDSVDVNNDQSEIISFEFKADTDLSATHKYALLAVVEDDECQQEYEKFELIREDTEIIIDSVKIGNENLFCGGGFDLSVDLRNIGIDEQDDVYVTLKNTKMKVNLETDEFEIEGYEGDDEVKKKFNVLIPSNIKSGDYSFTVDAKYNTDKIVREKFTVSLEACGDESIENAPDTITLGEIAESIKGILLGETVEDVSEEAGINQDTGSSPLRTLFILVLAVFLGVAGFVVFNYSKN